MTYSMMPVDVARKLFLLVLCEAVHEPLARTYLREKVKAIWQDQTADRVYRRLDLERQRAFDRLAEVEGFYRHTPSIASECTDDPAESSGLEVSPGHGDVAHPFQPDQ